MIIKLAPGKFKDKQRIKLVAVDPGKTIGVATTLLERIHKPNGDTWSFIPDTHLCAWPRDVDVLTQDIGGPSYTPGYATLPHKVIVEDWRLFTGYGPFMEGAELDGPQVLGFVKGTLHLWGEEDKLVIIQPSMKADPAYVKSKVGKAWPKTEHERDAICLIASQLLAKEK